MTSCPQLLARLYLEYEVINVKVVIYSILDGLSYQHLSCRRRCIAVVIQNGSVNRSNRERVRACLPTEVMHRKVVLFGAWRCPDYPWTSRYQVARLPVPILSG